MEQTVNHGISPTNTVRKKTITSDILDIIIMSKCMAY